MFMSSCSAPWQSSTHGRAGKKKADASVPTATGSDDAAHDDLLCSARLQFEEANVRKLGLYPHEVDNSNAATTAAMLFLLLGTISRLHKAIV